MKGYIFRKPEFSDCDLCMQYSLDEHDCHSFCIIREVIEEEKVEEEEFEEITYN